MGKLVLEFWDILDYVSNFFCQKIASFKLWKKNHLPKTFLSALHVLKKYPLPNYFSSNPPIHQEKKIYMTHNRKSKDYLFVKKTEMTS